MNRPRIIELIGPAGAGKSAVTAHLARMPGVLCTSIWTVPLSELAWASVCSIPAASSLVRRARAPLSRELRHIARLRALLNFLDRDALAAYRLVVVDEGAIYTLAYLRVIGHPIFRTGRAASWHESVSALWAATLDAIVSLDAPDAVLTQRLHTRRKPHQLSHASHAEITAFSHHYRVAYAATVSAVQHHGRIDVLEFRTDRESPTAIASRIAGAPVAAREAVSV